MPTQKKEEIIKNLSELLAKTRGVVFVDYQGQNTAQINALRKKLKEEECEFQVVKNTLLQIGLVKSNYPKIEFEGPTAVIFVKKDIFLALKILEGYTKVEELPKIKSGFWEKELVSKEQLENLAKIPSVEYLKGLVLNSLNAPLDNLVNALSWNLRQLAYVLNWTKEKSA